MPRHDPHPVLDRRAAECLRLLADPELDPDIALPEVGAWQAEALARAAVVHGTLSTMHRHIRTRTASGDGNVPSALATTLAEAEPVVLSAVGHSMHLRHAGERIAVRFRDGGVPAAIVKGPVAATRLYAHASDRAYTDVDIVVQADAVDRASEILTDLGFIPDDIPNRDAADHCEFKWTRKSGPQVHVELQTDLIHSSRLRQRISVDLGAISEAGDGDPSDATALLFVAGVHAALGHQFDRLELLIDVLQAMRGQAGPIDAERLISVCMRTGTFRAVAASLALTGRMYDQPKCTELARRLMPGRRPLEWSLVSPAIVLMAQSRWARSVAWRRKIFRQMLTRPAPHSAPAGAGRN